MSRKGSSIVSGLSYLAVMLVVGVIALSMVESSSDLADRFQGENEELKKVFEEKHYKSLQLTSLKEQVDELVEVAYDQLVLQDDEQRVVEDLTKHIEASQVNLVEFKSGATRGSEEGTRTPLELTVVGEIQNIQGFLLGLNKRDGLLVINRAVMSKSSRGVSASLEADLIIPGE